MWLWGWAMEDGRLVRAEYFLELIFNAQYSIFNAQVKLLFEH